MKTLLRLALVIGSFGLSSAAFAYSISGYVYCDTNDDGIIDENDTPLAGVDVTLVGPSFQLTVTTDETGSYSASGLVAGDWNISLEGSTLGAEATVALPSGGNNMVTLSWPDGVAFAEDINFLVDDPACQDSPVGLCWMTAGGVKFEPLLGEDMAEHGPKDSFGGNVYPSCSPYPGNGGQWNHVSHSSKLHFMGTDIEVIRCGNVPGIEPGSESPVTGFNYIEFQGVGWVQGIKGNKIARTPVTFTARVEDRNEPGNEQSATSGDDIDRYYLNVPGFLTVDDGAGGPITITGGNLQLHESSCE